MNCSKCDEVDFANIPLSAFFEKYSKEERDIVIKQLKKLGKILKYKKLDIDVIKSSEIKRTLK